MSYSHSSLPIQPTPEAARTDMVDALGRPLRDLRISVTDRCNFRCLYCMPRAHFVRHTFIPHKQLLSFEEITRISRILAPLGVQKIRLTGGEPLLRRDLPELVAALAAIEGIADLALTTNAVLLPRFAKRLRAAGLRRVTVSLDALDSALFRHICDADCTPAEVLRGIEAAREAGLQVKINMVVKRGLNESQILPMAQHFRHSGHTLRFIEYMDVGTINAWRPAEVMRGDEILSLLNSAFALEPIAAAAAGEVAQRYRYQDGAGEIGIIASISQPFCAHCSRLRLSTEGRLFNCLFASQGYDVRDLLRNDADDDAIRQQLIRLWQSRSEQYSQQRSQHKPAPQKIEMSYIGG